MLFKTLVILTLLFILFSLGSGLYFMMTDKGDSSRTVKALTFRIALSVGLFVVLLVAHGLGLIQPHGLNG